MFAYEKHTSITSTSNTTVGRQKIVRNAWLNKYQKVPKESSESVHTAKSFEVTYIKNIVNLRTSTFFEAVKNRFLRLQNLN